MAGLDAALREHDEAVEARRLPATTRAKIRTRVLQRCKVVTADDPSASPIARLRYAQDPPMSMGDLAAAVGCSERTVWTAEHRPQYVSGAMLDQIAHALGTTRSELLA